MNVDPENRDAFKKLAALSTLGIEFSVFVIVFLGLGYWLDKKWDTSPILSIIGIVLGSFGGFWNLIKRLKRLDE